VNNRGKQRQSPSSLSMGGIQKSWRPGTALQIDLTTVHPGC
jgi:hypothetical protein